MLGSNEILEIQTISEHHFDNRTNFEMEKGGTATGIGYAKLNEQNHIFKFRKVNSAAKCDTRTPALLYFSIFTDITRSVVLGKFDVRWVLGRCRWLVLQVPRTLR